MQNQMTNMTSLMRLSPKGSRRRKKKKKPKESIPHFLAMEIHGHTLECAICVGWEGYTTTHSQTDGTTPGVK